MLRMTSFLGVSDESFLAVKCRRCFGGPGEDGVDDLATASLGAESRSMVDGELAAPGVELLADGAAHVPAVLRVCTYMPAISRDVVCLVGALRAADADPALLVRARYHALLQHLLRAALRVLVAATLRLRVAHRRRHRRHRHRSRDGLGGVLGSYKGEKKRRYKDKSRGDHFRVDVVSKLR